MPGPSIASAAPTTASTMQVRRLSALEKAVLSSMITTNTPAIGVKNPIRRRTPPMVARDGHMIPCHSAAISISATPSWVRTIPAPNRRSKRPLPGQPLGNMENSRCREDLNDQVMRTSSAPNPQKPGLGYTSFEGGYSSMIPRFSPIVTAWVLSFAPSLERMFLTCPLTVSSVIDN